ncbi:MAG TPA: hypothetical protein VKZ63_19075, partial [Kofleriaceae bacterium]|nr:hypothetical protein [Kofleriaceae bacterium]
ASASKGQPDPAAAAAATSDAGANAEPGSGPAPVEEATAAPEAAPAAAAPAGPPGFDFRLARLDPSVAGSVRLCDVGELEPIGSGRAIVSCWNGAVGVPVELSYEPGQAAVASTIRRHHRIRVQITSGGKHTGGPEAHVRLLALVGEAPRQAARPAPPPPAAGGFDFSRVNRDPALDGTEQRCLILSAGRIAPVDAAASKTSPATWFAPGTASYWIRVTCKHEGGTSRLVIGASDPQPLLRLRPDAVARVRVVHHGRFPQREALGHLAGLAHEPPPPAW